MTIEIWVQDDFEPCPVYLVEKGVLGALYEQSEGHWAEWNPTHDHDTADEDMRLLAGDKLLYLGLGKFLHLRVNAKIYFLETSYSAPLFSRTLRLLSLPE